jgi:hypothetical protein
MSIIASVLFLSGIMPPVLLAQAKDSAAVVRGKVLEFKTREAIARALVSIREQGIEAMTTSDGTFELANVRPGTVEVSITTVGYGLSRKRIELAAGSTVELEFLLDQEALKHTEDITVSAGLFSRATATRHSWRFDWSGSAIRCDYRPTSASISESARFSTAITSG